MAGAIDTFKESAKGLQGTLAGTVRVFTSFTDAVETFAGNITKANKALIDFNAQTISNQRNLNLYGVSIKEYDNAIEEMSKSTTLSKKELAGLSSEFLKMQTGMSRNMSEMQNMIVSMNKIGISAEKTKEYLGALSTAYNKLGISISDLANSEDIGSMMALDDATVEKIFEYQDAMSGATGEIDDSGINKFNKSMYSMSKSIEDMVLSLQKAFAPMFEKMASATEMAAKGVGHLAKAIESLFKNNSWAAWGAAGISTLASIIGLVGSLSGALKIAQKGLSVLGVGGGAAAGAAKAGGGVLGKLFPKLAGKTLAKAIPGVGAIVGAVSGINNIRKGNIKTGLLDFAAGGASFIPGVGTALSLALGVGAGVAEGINATEAEEAAKKAGIPTGAPTGTPPPPKTTSINDVMERVAKSGPGGARIAQAMADRTAEAQRLKDKATEKLNVAEKNGDAAGIEQYKKEIDALDQKMKNLHNPFKAIVIEMKALSIKTKGAMELFNEASSKELTTQAINQTMNAKQATEAAAMTLELQKQKVPFVSAELDMAKAGVVFKEAQYQKEQNIAQKEILRLEVLKSKTIYQNKLNESMKLAISLAENELVAATAGIKAKKESTNLDVQRAEAAEALAKESMLGIGFSAQAAKNTFEQKNEAAKLATQEHQIVVAKREEARAALASATTEEQKQKAQAKFDVASKESKKTEIDMMNKQKDVMASLNKLREGYLDILGDAVFGIGEMSIIAQSDSGMANMGPGSARYGGRGQGRMGPAATMTATGGMWMPGEQSSGSIGYNTMTAWVGGLQASGQAGYALGRAAGALQQTQFGYGAVTVNVGGSAPVNVPAMF